MILYSSGTAINFILHLTLRLLSKDEPGFFTGYNTVPAVLVIVSNVFIGLAITAVYKCMFSISSMNSLNLKLILIDADAVVKCLATAVATGILLYISPILFAIEMSPLIIPGGLIVFISSWLYMEAAPPKDQQQGLNMASTAKKSLFGVLAAFMNVRPSFNGFVLQLIQNNIHLHVFSEISEGRLNNMYNRHNHCHSST